MTWGCRYRLYLVSAKIGVVASGTVGFSRHGSGVRWGERGALVSFVEARTPGLIGPPSTELSLARLRPRRARLRFARRRDHNEGDWQEQGQCQRGCGRLKKSSKENGVFGLDNGVHCIEHSIHAWPKAHCNVIHLSMEVVRDVTIDRAIFETVAVF